MKRGLVFVVFWLALTAMGPCASAQLCGGDLSSTGGLCGQINNPINHGAGTAPVALTDGATIAVNAALSNSFTVTLGGNRTLGNPSNLVAGQTLTFAISQPASGGPDTLAYGGDYKWAGGTAPTLSTGASAKDVITCWADTSSTLQCTSLLNMH